MHSCNNDDDEKSEKLCSCHICPEMWSYLSPNEKMGKFWIAVNDVIKMYRRGARDGQVSASHSKREINWLNSSCMQCRIQHVRVLHSHRWGCTVTVAVCVEWNEKGIITKTGRLCLKTILTPQIGLDQPCTGCIWIPAAANMGKWLKEAREWIKWGWNVDKMEKVEKVMLTTAVWTFWQFYSYRTQYIPWLHTITLTIVDRKMKYDGV